MAACRALREAASLGGGMEGKDEHVDMSQGQGGLGSSPQENQDALHSRGHR